MAGLERPRGQQGEVALAVAKQRGPRAQQGPVEVGVDAAQCHHATGRRGERRAARAEARSGRGRPGGPPGAGARRPRPAPSSAIGRSACSGWWELRRSPTSTCAIASAPTSVEHVDQHRHLHAVAGGERDSLEHASRRRDLARERLLEARQLGVERRQQRTRGRAGSRARRRPAPPVRRQRTGAGRTPSRTARGSSTISGPARPVTNARVEVARVGVDVTTTSSPRTAASARHMASPLPVHRPELGHEVGLLAHLRAGARRRPRRCRPLTPRPPPAPGRRARRGRGFARTIGPTVSATSRAGSTTRQRRPLALEQQLEREVGVVEGARHGARTMANRWPRPARRRPGSRSSSAARASSWWRARASAPRTRCSSPCPTSSTRRCARRWPAPASNALYAHQADALDAALEGPHDRRPPAPPAASRWRSTCPCSTRSAATAPRGRSTSTPPRRWRRTRRARCTRCGLPSLRPAIYDGDTPQRGARAPSASART